MTADHVVGPALQQRMDQYVENAILTLRREANGESLTLVIDPILADPLRRAAHFPDRVFTLPNIHADLDTERSPYLLHFPNEVAAERLINESLRLAVREALGDLGADYRGRSLCAWLCGESDPYVLARRLAAAARVFRPDGKSWLLRYWDPRVLWHLPRALAAQHWQMLVEQMGNWWSFGPMLQFQRLHAGNQGLEGPTRSEGGTAGLPLRFDVSGWQRLERIEAINKVLHSASSWGVPPGDESARQVDALLVRCLQWGYFTERDTLVFAACALTSHLSFDQHPRVQQALREGVRQGTSLQATLAEFDDEFWDEVASGDWLSPRLEDTRTG